MNIPRVTVIIPAYNEEAGIETTLLELKNSMPDNYDIIVVDDGSKDNTYAIASGIDGQRIRVIRHKKNKGYGSAIKTACRQSEGDIVAWYDADGQHRPKDLIGVVNHLVENKLDYCIGIRTSQSYVEKGRKLGKKALAWIANRLAKEPMEDVNSGLRAFRRDVLLRHTSLLPERFGASTVTSFIMQEMDYAGGAVPIVVRKREGISTVRPLKDGLETLRLIVDIVLLFRAKQVLTRMGLLSVIIGTIYGTVSAVMQKLGVPVLAAILVIFGIQMYFFGMLSAQISALRLENHDAAKM